MKKIIIWLIFLLSLSVCLNLFQRQNQAVTCENIDKSRKAELLYFLWHKSLDWDKDGIPCDYLHNNQE